MSELTKQELRRYNRHIILPNFGLESQEKLKKAKVLVIGAGGLGSPVLQYLTAAGVGSIGIIDDDVVEQLTLAISPKEDEDVIDDEVIKQLAMTSDQVSDIDINKLYVLNDNLVDIQKSISDDEDIMIDAEYDEMEENMNQEQEQDLEESVDDDVRNNMKSDALQDQNGDADDNKDEEEIDIEEDKLDVDTNGMYVINNNPMNAQKSVSDDDKIVDVGFDRMKTLNKNDRVGIVNDEDNDNVTPDVLEDANENSKSEIMFNT